MKKYILILLFTFFYLNIYSQQGDSLIQVTDRLYMITGHGGNVSFLVTEKGVLLVDAGSNEMDGKIIEDHIKSVTEKPIQYIVLTHYHYDHTFGVYGFTENPLIIGHHNIVNNLKTFGQGYLDMYKNRDLKPKVELLKQKMDSLKQVNDVNWKEAEKEYISHAEQLANANKIFIVLPDITFQNQMTVYLDTDTINLIYPNNTHTDCNILVEFVNQNVLATGDFLFNNCMPYIDFAAGCNTKNWIEQIRKLAGKDYQYIIPGHGKLANKTDLQNQANYLSDLRNEIQIRINKKQSLSQIHSDLKMTKYKDYDFQFMLSNEIDAVYNELTKPENK